MQSMLRWGAHISDFQLVFMNRDFCIHDKLFLDNLAEIIDLANRTQKDEYVDLDALKGTVYCI